MHHLQNEEVRKVDEKDEIISRHDELAPRGLWVKVCTYVPYQT